MARKGAKEKEFQKALAGIDLPVLTLDNRWHKLFTQRAKTPEIEALVDEISALMARRAQLRDEERKVKALKKKLMGEIMGLRDRVFKEGENSPAAKELDDHTRLINDCNARIEAYQDEQIDLPREIYQKNLRLMILSMNICYEKLHANSEVIEEIDEWISKVRVQLKKQVIKKQEKEIENFNLYSYMHQIFGAEVMEIFDINYDPEKQHPIRTMDINSRAGVLNDGDIKGRTAPPPGKR
ncbi:MAG: hypothetical protein K6B72_11220 [Lachnospiraceae bacterium]|nr:hypothetical protein [Lachnospiraceae bacterium]